MSLQNLTNNSEFKKLTAKFWRWGIALAILGGVFMLNGWPYGNIIISIAGFILFIIYFLVGFEPLKEEIDWTIVYPELAGIYDEDEVASIKYERLKKVIEDLDKEKEALKNK